MTLPSAQNEAADHYDKVTASWQFVLGEHFHFAESAATAHSLPQGTARLIARAADGLKIGPMTRIADFGCGIGGPARWLAKTYGCQVLGLTNSAAGIKAAKDAAGASTFDQTKVTYRHCDAQVSGLGDGAFDLAWCMEAAHLFPDKVALFREMARILPAGGQAMVCDLVLGTDYPKRHTPELIRTLLRLRAAFGPVLPLRAEDYGAGLTAAGFGDLRSQDLSELVRGTGAAWRDALEQNLTEIAGLARPEEVEVMRRGIESVDYLLQRNLMGYVMLWGETS